VLTPSRCRWSVCPTSRDGDGNKGNCDKGHGDEGL